MTSDPTGTNKTSSRTSSTTVRPSTIRTTATVTGGQRSAYVWAWLPAATAPVVAGVVAPTGAVLDGDPVLAFRYAASYLPRPEAISLFTPELPLTDATFDPRRTPGRGPHRDPLPLAGCLRDAAPDAWGRRVINLRRSDNPEADLGELTYLLSSGSNRIGGLDFQASPTDYVTRDEDASLEQLLELAALVEAGASIPDSLAAAAQHGTSIGGARPKALLTDGDRHLVAKFSSTTDTRPVVKAEAAAMLLAAHAGLDVAPVQVHQVAGRDVLLVERFDRTFGPVGVTRRLMLSMLTILGYTAMAQRHASYAEIAAAIRTGPWTNVPGTLEELYGRLVLNILVGNNDDHLRNHSAFWDGTHLQLTPAYDVAPQIRSTSVSNQAIGITVDGRRSSQLHLCRDVAGDFLLTPARADQIIDRVRGAVVNGWDEACDQAQITAAEKADLWGREFMNAYAAYDVP